MPVMMKFKIAHFGGKKGRNEIEFEKSCDSFNYNFMRYLANSFANSALVNVIDTGNVSRAISYAGICNILAPAGNTVYGIRVGTSGTAAAPGDYTLGGLISTGIGDGLLAYGGVTVLVPEIEGNIIKMHLKRTFINGGTVAITMRELDVVSSTGGYNVQMLRDAFADQVIPPMDGVSVDIIIQVTV